jgi:hypothetical protein
MNLQNQMLIILCFLIMTLLSACDSGTQQNTQQNNAVQPAAEQSPVRTATVQGSNIDIDDNDIAGIVTSRNGPEAGVWVIAETDAFQTRFTRIVTTDDEGRYLIPDLPDADYTLWVRGYGLTDSNKVYAEPGSHVDLTVVPAPDRATAAEVYPAAYWYAMMHTPDENEISFLEGGLHKYLSIMKNSDCLGCHQLGNKATRTFPAMFAEMDFESSQAAWTRRISSGQAGARMMRPIGQAQGVPLKYLADWTDRIAAGELPFEDPERPSGQERNIVVTIRDWMAQPYHYVHDLSGTDRRNPTVNGYGPLYGAPELSTDEFPILDPVNNTATTFTAPVRDADTPSTGDDPLTAPSAYWGDEVIWDSKANAHNPMLDQTGRVWYTARIRGRDNPDFCKEGSDHPSAQLFPTNSAGRQLAVYEPDTGNYTFVDTCFGTHHLQFAYDEDNTLWTSGGGDVIGWLNTRIFDETGSAEAALGWSPLILDTNGNGVRDEWVEPNEPVNPNLDKRVRAGYYAVMPNPADGSVWGSNNAFPGAIVRFDPETGLGEKFNVPLPGFSSRGADIDRNGVVWVALGSGHLGEFDRRKCQGPLNGPEATGDHCPEGWIFHELPGPSFIDLPDTKVESSYYAWVDQHNTFGLGENIPMVIGNLFDGVHALVDGEFVTINIPYPLGFYTKGFEGRIDDPDAGWKGRGLWVPSGGRNPWFLETGKGTRPIVVHFQLRPDPLAK